MNCVNCTRYIFTYSHYSTQLAIDGLILLLFSSIFDVMAFISIFIVPFFAASILMGK